MKHLAIVLVALLVVALVSCVPKALSTPTAAINYAPLRTDYENALPPLTQVLVGTFRLADTDLAVKGPQAKELATLWKGYRALSQSDSAAPQELQGLTRQIIETMTEEQLKAIAAMQLTRDDMMAIMQEQGVGFGGRGGAQLSPEQLATRQAQRASGGGGFGPGGPGGEFFFPGGGFPGGGGNAPSAQQIATLRAQRGGSTTAAAVPTQLVDALIKKLREAAG
ncbi:MAG: hypothetical protein H5T69_06680 [Chloroflexi bacterium]|nr:hypothetical protein [Chloroflexota bacterium]